MTDQTAKETTNMLTVYGSSDNGEFPELHVEGDVNDRWAAPDMGDEAMVACSDGTLLRAAWDTDRACWEIRVAERGTCRAAATIGDDGGDVVTLDGPAVRWVAYDGAVTTVAGRPR